jgi:putative endonuclease
MFLLWKNNVINQCLIKTIYCLRQTQLTLHWWWFLSICFVKNKIGKPVSIGAIGEFHTRIYLQQKGLVFVDANWHCRGGEIDLIMQHALKNDSQSNDSKNNGNIFLVFIEVKTRQLNSLVSAEESVDYHKQRHLIHAANKYLQHINYEPYCRFDVVTVDNLGNQKTQIKQWIQGAFEG